ncbi:MAG: hypothetical protein RMK99_02340 [Anaerolineales bacterium]|nr:hypothetical protein [Anaerolineales bacterium]
MLRQQFTIQNQKSEIALVLAFALLAHLTLAVLQPDELSGDAARLGLHTWDFLKRDAWPFYIYHLFAPNPLIIWLHALAFVPAGPTVAALHGTTIVVGVLCAGLAYLFTVTVFDNEDATTARRAGMLAGLSLPLIPVWNVFVHGGTEHILLPFFALLSGATLWRGLRSGRCADFALAGVALGVSQYGYIVARALPPALALAALVALWRGPALRRHRRGLLLTLLTFGAIALPQWWLFATAPYTLFARTGQEAGRFIFGEPDALSLFGVKLWQQWLALGWRWESGYNPSGRGLLPALLSAAALLGVIAALRARTPAALFTLTLTGALMLPDLITVEGTWPSATRLIGAMPLWAILAGYGAALVVERRPRRVQSMVASAFVFALVLGAGLENQLHHALVVLPRRLSEPGREWMSSLVEQAEAEYILSHTAEPILIPADEYQRAPLAFRLTAHYRERSGAVEAPLAQGEAVTVITPVDPLRPTTDGVPSRPVPDAWVLLRDGVAYFLPPLPGNLGPLQPVTTLFARNGAPAAQVARASWRPVRNEWTPSELRFENGLTLAAHHVSAATLTPGAPLVVTLYWRAERPITQDLQLFTQVLDRHNQMVAGVHDWPLRGTYRPNAWRASEWVPLSYMFEMPADLPPGEYRLFTGVFDIVHQRRIPLIGGEDAAFVTRLKAPLSAPPFEPARPSRAEFGGMLRLRGYTLTSGGVRLLWQAIRPPDFNYTLFVHALDSAGNLIAQADTEPLGGQYPTSLWDAGETVPMDVPLSLPPETASVRLGWYRWDTGARLPATEAGQRLPEDALPLDWGF